MVGNRRAETPGHSILKHLIASVLERRGHDVDIEFRAGSKGIIDVMDHTTEIGYEIQTKRQKDIEKAKALSYSKYVGVTDVVFIYVFDFPIDMGADLLCKFLEGKLL